MDCSKVKYILVTERLYLREFLLTDAQKMYELNANPEVIRYTGDVAFKDVASAKQFIANYADYSENGYGRWAVIRKSDNEFLGWCGLKKHKDGLVDIGFRFFQEFWGNGYATESAKASLEYGFDVLKIDTIIGRALRANKASIAVLEKLQMNFWKVAYLTGFGDAIYYRKQHSVD